MLELGDYLGLVGGLLQVAADNVELLRVEGYLALEIGVLAEEAGVGELGVGGLAGKLLEVFVEFEDGLLQLGVGAG